MVLVVRRNVQCDFRWGFFPHFGQWNDTVVFDKGERDILVFAEAAPLRPWHSLAHGTLKANDFLGKDSTMKKENYMTDLLICVW